MPPREKGMRNRKAAEVNADIEARIAQIEQMTLDQIAVFQSRILTDITTGRISPKEAGAIDRALRNRERLSSNCARPAEAKGREASAAMEGRQVLALSIKTRQSGSTRF